MYPLASRYATCLYFHRDQAFLSCHSTQGETRGQEDQWKHSAAMFFFFTFSDYYAAKKSQAIEKIMERFPKQHISFFTNLNYSSSGEYLDSSIKTIDIC